MDVSSEAILGVSGFSASAVCWWINRVISSFDREIEKLWGGTREIEEALQELRLTVARLEASHSKHK